MKADSATAAEIKAFQSTLVAMIGDASHAFENGAGWFECDALPQRLEGMFDKVDGRWICCPSYSQMVRFNRMFAAEATKSS